MRCAWQAHARRGIHAILYQNNVQAMTAIDKLLSTP
jgi:hypothetical protein